MIRIVNITISHNSMIWPGASDGNTSLSYRRIRCSSTRFNPVPPICSRGWMDPPLDRSWSPEASLQFPEYLYSQIEDPLFTQTFSHNLPCLLEVPRLFSPLQAPNSSSLGHVQGARRTGVCAVRSLSLLETHAYKPIRSRVVNDYN